MERENSFITRWNEKKDTTVSGPAEPKWKSPMGVLLERVFVCVCARARIDLPECVGESQME